MKIEELNEIMFKIKEDIILIKEAILDEKRKEAYRLLDLVDQAIANLQNQEHEHELIDTALETLRVEFDKMRSIYGWGLN